MYSSIILQQQIESPQNSNGKEWLALPESSRSTGVDTVHKHHTNTTQTPHHTTQTPHEYRGRMYVQYVYVGTNTSYRAETKQKREQSISLTKKK